MEQAAIDDNNNNNNNNHKERIQCGRETGLVSWQYAVVCGAESANHPKHITSHTSSDYFMVCSFWQLRGRRKDACCQNRILGDNENYRKIE